jgi:hypothetical protein
MGIQVVALHPGPNVQLELTHSRLNLEVRWLPQLLIRLALLWRGHRLELSPRVADRLLNLSQLVMRHLGNVGHLRKSLLLA